MRWFRGRAQAPAPGHPVTPPMDGAATSPQRQAPAPGPVHGPLEESDAEFPARLERELREP